MIRNKCLMLFLIMVSLLTLIYPTSIWAEQIDPNQEVSLAILFEHEENPLVGAEFDLYMIASADANGHLELKEEFKGYSFNPNGMSEEAYRTLASTLEGYVLKDQLTPLDTSVSNQDGMVFFPKTQTSLYPGLYLVLGKRFTDHGTYYDALPFIVFLPGKNADGLNDYSMDVKAKYEATSQEVATISRKVLKVWKDTGFEYQRPQSVTVELLQDGTVYDTVVLNAENNWSYQWDELSNESKWTIVEEIINDYRTEITRDGITFVVTNHCTKTPPTPTPTPTPPSKPTIPVTGQTWWPVPILFASGLLFLFIGIVIKRKAENEI